MQQHNEVSQLTAQSASQQTVGACRETLRQAHVAVVRHVSVSEDAKQITAFVLDAGLPDGTKLYTGGQLRMAEEGGQPAMHAHEVYPGGPAYACSGHHHNYVTTGPEVAPSIYDGVHGHHTHRYPVHAVSWPNNDGITREGFAEYYLGKPFAAPLKVTNVELLAIYQRLDGEAIVASVEPGSRGDAILAAFGRAVLEAYGVQLTEERA